MAQTVWIFKSTCLIVFCLKITCLGTLSSFFCSLEQRSENENHEELQNVNINLIKIDCNEYLKVGVWRLERKNQSEKWDKRGQNITTLLKCASWWNLLKGGILYVKSFTNVDKSQLTRKKKINQKNETKEGKIWRRFWNVQVGEICWI